MFRSLSISTLAVLIVKSSAPSVVSIAIYSFAPSFTVNALVVSSSIRISTDARLLPRVSFSALFVVSMSI